MMILSLLGLSVYDTKSRYENSTNFKINKGDFVNSTDVLLHSFEDEKFIFLGTDRSKEVHEEKFSELIAKRDVQFIEYDQHDLNDIFIKIMNTLIENRDEKIVFDITHSFRDSVIMSVISTIISQIVYRRDISMIYAKEVEKFKVYRYELVSEDILNTSNIATILSTFLSTFKVPSLNSKYELYTILNDFSTHLVSNQFKDIYEKDIPALEGFIKENKEKLFFIEPLLDKLGDLLKNIKETKTKNTYEQFIFFSELFYHKDYFLHSSTYLIEAITYHIGAVFKELHYITFDVIDYENQQKIVSLLKLNYNTKDFNFPNEYFVDINIEMFNKFYLLREKVAKIRHNLAHINIYQDYGTIERDLKNAIVEYNSLVDSKILYTLDKTLDRKKETVKYKLEQYYVRTKKYNKINQSFSKLEKIINKHNDNKLSDLTNYKIDQLSNFIKKNKDEIQNLFDAKKNRKLLPNGTSSKNQQEVKKVPNGEQRVKSLKKSKKKIVQTEEDKENLSKLGDLLSKKFQ